MRVSSSLSAMIPSISRLRAVSMSGSWSSPGSDSLRSPVE